MIGLREKGLEYESNLLEMSKGGMRVWGRGTQRLRSAPRALQRVMHGRQLVA